MNIPFGRRGEDGARPRQARGEASSGSRRVPDGRQHSPYQSSSMPGFDNRNVRYLDAESLNRPLDMPRQVKTGAIIALVAAMIVGGMVLFTYFDRVVNAPAREKAQLEEMLATPLPLTLPDLAALAPLDDESIMSTLAQSGDTYFEKTPIGTLPTGGFDVIKLPADISLADAGVMYVSGLDKLSALDAARLLNGSWDLEVNRDDALSIRVRYADFHAETVEVAVQRAIDAEGLTDAAIEDSGVDESGNTYAAGTIERDGAKYAWRVSALELSKVYKIKDLPGNTFYVGVRFTAI